MSSSTSSSSPPAPPTARRTLVEPLRTMLFLAIVAAMLGITGELLESVALTLDGEAIKTREMTALRGEKNDIVYLGDSTVVEGVNPAVVDELLGTKSYNVATAGQSFLAAEMVLRQYLANNTQPRMLVLGIFVNRPRLSSQMDYPLYQSLPPDLRRLYLDRWLKYDGKTMALGDTFQNSLKAYRYRSAIGYGIKYLVGGKTRLPKLIRGHLAFDFSRGPESAPKREVSASPRGLDELLAFCAERRLPVLMFEPPNTPGYSATTRGRDGFLAHLQSCVGKNTVVAFRSFNDEASLAYTKDEWLGLNHLNARGAARFSREQIVPYLREHIDLLRPEPPH